MVLELAVINGFHLVVQGSSRDQFICQSVIGNILVRAFNYYVEIHNSNNPDFGARGHELFFYLVHANYLPVRL